MAKPIIYFTGVKWTAGSQTGYRPQLETSLNKITDYALANEIVVNRRLSLSPDELLYAIQETLDCVPELMAADGVPREFTNHLAWTRTASGTLAASTSDWNDTCKANIKVQLKGTTKTIDGNFQNALTSPIPKVNNVTYVGATTAQNCVMFGTPFVAYGRNLQYDPLIGDEATLTVNGTPYALSATESDTAHIKFSWPDGATAVEVGSVLTFTLVSRAGVSGGEAYTNTRSVTLVGDARKQIVIDTLEQERGSTEHIINISGQNFKYIEGYIESEAENYSQFPVTVTVNGTQLTGTYTADAEYEGGIFSIQVENEKMPLGATASITVQAQAGSTEVKPGTVTKTFTVEDEG